MSDAKKAQKAELKVVLMADETVVAESCSVNFWNNCLGTIIKMDSEPEKKISDHLKPDKKD